MDGATDVTGRYVRNGSHAADRDRCPEEVLLYIMNEIRTLRRAKLTKEGRFRLENEDHQEDMELRGYIFAGLVESLVGSSQGSLSALQSPKQGETSSQEEEIKGKSSKAHPEAADESTIARSHNH